MLDQLPRFFLFLVCRHNLVLNLDVVVFFTYEFLHFFLNSDTSVFKAASSSFSTLIFLVKVAVDLLIIAYTKVSSRSCLNSTYLSARGMSFFPSPEILLEVSNIFNRDTNSTCFTILPSVNSYQLFRHVCSARLFEAITCKIS